MDEFCKDDLIFDWYLKELGEIDCDNLNILSIGCGQGQRELLLADKFNINITAIDNAPYTNELNFVAKELGLSDKVKFTNMSGKKLSFGDESFDIIISHAVVYCIDDEELNNFYSEKFRVLKNNGLVFMSTGSNISIFSKIKIYLKKILKKNDKPCHHYKQTGWQRDVKHVLRYLPVCAFVNKITYGGEENDIPLFLKNKYFRFIIYILIFISKNIYPILGNYSKIFIVKKIK